MEQRQIETRRLQAGDAAPHFSWPDPLGGTVRLADLAGRRTLLTFHRFASCPLCNLRIHRLVGVHPALQEAGLAVVAFFQSPAESIRQGVGRQGAPFPILADPDRVVYDQYRVESTSSPSSMPPARRMLDAMEGLSRGFLPRNIDGDTGLLPAAFLLREDLVIATAHYGRDVGDHLPIEDVLAFARGETP